MFGAHIPELIIFLVLALVIFGPKRLPEIGNAMGKGIREFRKGTTTDPPGEPALLQAEKPGDIRIPDPAPVEAESVASAPAVEGEKAGGTAGSSKTAR